MQTWKLKPLTLDDVTITISAEEDDTEVRGNALASGDEDADRQCENEILVRLADGDVWAWAVVTVTVEWHGLEWASVLGGCSYQDEADFKASSGYYEQLCDEALEGLNRRLRRLVAALRPHVALGAKKGRVT